VKSARRHHGTEKSVVEAFLMFVEKNGSGYLLFCSRPAKTVERADTGYQPEVE